MYSSISFAYMAIPESEEKESSILLEKIDLYDYINSLLYSIGMPMNLSGFRYISKLIYKRYNEKDSCYKLYKILYSEIAEEEQFKTSCSRIERCIRTAIDSCLNNDDMEYIRTPIIGKMKKMSITEFTNAVLIYMDRNMGS